MLARAGCVPRWGWCSNTTSRSCPGPSERTLSTERYWWFLVVLLALAVVARKLTVAVAVAVLHVLWRRFRKIWHYLALPKFYFYPYWLLSPFLLQAGASQAEIEAAAKAANAHDFIVALPDGYNSEVHSVVLKLYLSLWQHAAVFFAIWGSVRNILQMQEIIDSVVPSTQANAHFHLLDDIMLHLNITLLLFYESGGHGRVTVVRRTESAHRPCQSPCQGIFLNFTTRIPWEHFKFTLPALALPYLRAFVFVCLFSPLLFRHIWFHCLNPSHNKQQDPAVLLLDEPTAALDADSEQSVISALSRYVWIVK